MDTCSEKRTLGGLVRNWAFLAALIKADLGDWRYKKKESKFEVCFKEALCTEESPCDCHCLKDMLAWMQL